MGCFGERGREGWVGWLMGGWVDVEFGLGRGIGRGICCYDTL